MNYTQDHSEFRTPVLLNVFNRPEETSGVLAVLAEQQVPILYVHCDGARDGRNDDAENINAVKSLIASSVTWPCELHTMYEDKNYGCGVGPYRAISWFFDNVEEGIILEDDCVPHPDFFMYCQELLERYRDNEQIAVIGGTNRHPTWTNTQYSYYFSPYAETWGWATWRRVWKEYDYDFDVADFDFISHVLPHIKSYGVARHWLNLLRQMRKDNAAGTKTYWDFQLDLLSLYKHWINIIPSVNMISNIGFNSRATHTFGSSHANAAVHGILPLKHPQRIYINLSGNKEFNIMGHLVKQFIKRLIHIK